MLKLSRNLLKRKPLLFRASPRALYSTPTGPSTGTPNDVSNRPSLNQFQNPQQSPDHYFGNINQQPLQLSGQKGNVNSSSQPVNGTPKRPKVFAWIQWGSLTCIVALLAYGISGIVEIYNEEFKIDSPKIVEMLKEGMIAENEADYEKALKIYQNCLKQADIEKLDKLNHNYTGIILKIAEILEQLGELDKALAVYKTTSEFLINELCKPQTNKSAILKELDVDKAIQYAIAVTMRYASLMPTEKSDESRQALLTIIGIAETRLIDLFPSYMPVLSKDLYRMIIKINEYDMEHFCSPSEKRKRLEILFNKDLKVPTIPPHNSQVDKLLSLSPDGWAVFTGDLVAARDLYADICIDVGDYSEARLTLQKNIELMHRSFDEVSRIVQDTTKLGVVVFLIEEQLKFNVKSRPDLLPNKMLVDNVERSTNDQEFMNGLTNRLLEIANLHFTRSLELVDKVNSEALSKQTDLPQHVELSFHLAKMMSHCGMAAIDLKEEKYREARTHLLQARGLAVKYGIQGWIQDVDASMALIQEKLDS